VRDERGELLARAASDFRALLAREEQRMRSLLAAAAAGSAPVRAASPTALPTTRLAHTTLLGLPSGPVDVRTASVDEIAAIPAIGPERAALLVAARETRPIASVDDVVEVLGLTAVDLVRARSYLRF
jgi:DNA uptake protein ComE-like DNA-binding protein